MDYEQRGLVGSSRKEAFMKRREETLQGVETNPETVFRTEYQNDGKDFSQLNWSDSVIMRNNTQKIIESSKRFLELIMKAEEERDSDGIDKTQKNCDINAVSSTGVASGYVLDALGKK